MESTCAPDIFGIWLSDAVAFASKKTEECDGPEQLDSEKVDTGQRRFLLKTKHMKKWRHRYCSLRSSERWRRRQRLKGMPSLPDVRHQIAKLLVRILKC